MRDFATSENPDVQAQLDRLAALALPQGRIGLDAIRVLLTRLGEPQRRLPPVFHVAGTNGKGSTCAFLRAMLEAQGLRVHATTSPHLVRYNERIRIAGQLIGDSELAALLKEVLDAAEGLEVSFFETTIAAAFLAFSRHRADACVVEVGLGGRLDATNVLERPAACGVASLGIDHERFLLAPEEGAPADPMARIAWEKASIAKPGIPLVTQAYGPEATREIEALADARGAVLAMRGMHWSADVSDAIRYRDATGELALPLPAMSGRHQADNAALAVAMLRHQRAIAVSPEAMAEGIRAARWPARMQRMGFGPLAALLPAGTPLWLDGGHNPDAGRALARALPSGEVHLVIGMLANKDMAGFLAPLVGRVASVRAVPIPGHDHADPGDICARASEVLGAAEAMPAADLPDALASIARDGHGAPVVICGSLYLAGEALRLNGELPD